MKRAEEKEIEDETVNGKESGRERGKRETDSEANE